LSIDWIEEAVNPEICYKPNENKPASGCLRLRNIGWSRFYIAISKSIQWIHQHQMPTSLRFRIQEV